jgi:hypothetical protein
MRVRFNRNVPALLCGALLIVFGSGWAIDAQGPSPAARQTVPSSPTVKKPLSYDAYDYWRSIQGTTLSRDGEWLAYALIAEAADGELVVRNLRTGTEHKHPRGTNPTFTADGNFVAFTVAQTKADEERDRLAAQRNSQSQGRGQGENEGQSQSQRNQPKTGAGIMALATGQVSIVERVGSVSMPEESSSWVAMHRGNGGAGRGGRGGRGAGGRGAPPPAGRGQAVESPGRADGAPRGKRKDPGNDLIVRNLTTNEDITIPLVTDFAWSKDGAWLA